MYDGASSRHSLARLVPLASTGNLGIHDVLNLRVNVFQSAYGLQTHRRVCTDPVAQIITSTSCSWPVWSMNPVGVTVVISFVKTVTFSRSRASRNPFPGCKHVWSEGKRQSCREVSAAGKLTYSWSSTSYVKVLGYHLLHQLRVAREFLLHLGGCVLPSKPLKRGF
jgi:hypothetical protein